MVELKPCPFCGGKVRMALSGQGYYNWFYIHGSSDDGECHCRIFMESERFDIRQKKIEDKKAIKKNLADKWNRRVNDV